MSYPTVERSAPSRPVVLEHEVATLRRLLRAAERELEVADSQLEAERRENEALRADLHRALARVAGISRAACCGAPGGLRHLSRGEPLESGPARGGTFAPAPSPRRVQ